MNKFVSLRLRWLSLSAFWFAAWAIAAPSSAIASVARTSEIQPESSSLNQTASLLLAQDSATAQLDSIQATTDGFFIRTRGAAPLIEMPRQPNSERMTFIVENGALSSQFNPATLPQNINGVSQWTVTALEDGGLEITLDLAAEGVTWQASASPLGGIVIIPVSGRSNIINFQATETPTEAVAAPAVIQSITVSPTGILQIDADSPFTTEESWDRATAYYRIVIPNARLGEGVLSPAVPANSALLRVTVSQDGDSVVVLAQPAAGVFVVGGTMLADQQFALELDQNGRRVPLARNGDIDTSSGELPDLSDQTLVVVLDPGHGGTDPGAVGINGLSELDVVLPVAQEVAAILEEQGVSATLTRTNDSQTIDLAPRVQTAERADADLFVSIHANAISMSRPDINGIETYYASDRGRPLAQAIQSNMVELTGMRDRGIKTARFYVIVNTSMPAVLVELGFVTGSEDAPLLSDPAVRSLMAEAIARGILEYAEQNF
ncbi:MAG: N-acetylmuramoyl-L-alanine amidase [Synechococcales cyanobacterium T60_A2020_003]|nr:N-acetylmuramoyl-L-alanine amidase [Synechococcales cyanobacterium T60_A2020_003]